MGNNYKIMVTGLLKNNPNGLTIRDLADNIGTTRHTVSIALAELKGEGKLLVRKIGMAKLHFWRQE